MMPYTPTAASSNPSHGGCRGRPLDAWRQGRSAAVPAGVHAGRQLQRTVERALQDRHRHSAQAAQALDRDAALAPRLTHVADRLDQLWREGQGHRHRHASFVEHRREAAQQPVGTRQ